MTKIVCKVSLPEDGSVSLESLEIGLYRAYNAILRYNEQFDFQEGIDYPLTKKDIKLKASIDVPRNMVDLYLYAQRPVHLDEITVTITKGEE